MGQTAFPEPPSALPTDADRCSERTSKSSRQQAKDEAVMTPNNMAPTLCSCVRNELLNSCNAQAKDDHVRRMFGSLGKGLKRRGALVVRDLKTQMQGAFGSFLNVPVSRDDNRRASAPSAIGPCGPSRYGSNSFAHHSSLHSRPTHMRSVSHSYAHDLLHCECKLRTCDCAVCDLVLRRIDGQDPALRDTSPIRSSLLNAPSRSRTTTSPAISSAILHDILSCDSEPETHHDSALPAPPGRSADSREEHSKPLPALPAKSGSRHSRSSSDSGTTTSSGSSLVHTPDQSVRQSARRVPVPQDSPASEQKSSCDQDYNVGLSDLSLLASGLDSHDIAANYLALQVIGAMNFQKRAMRRADSDTWSTLVITEAMES